MLAVLTALDRPHRQEGPGDTDPPLEKSRERNFTLDELKMYQANDGGPAVRRDRSQKERRR